MMKVKRVSPLALALLVVVAGLAAAPASAGFDIDFGASINLGDDADLYLHISSRYFDRDRAFVKRYARRYDHPDDLAVALYLSKCSGRSADRIFSLRRNGLSWWEISVRLGQPMDIWFVRVRRDPGPPYGKAYGYWKKHKRDRTHTVVLGDADIRNLVAVRMIHEYYDVPVEVAMEWRSSGRSLPSIMSGEYHNRRGKPGSKSHGSDKHPGRGKGKGNKNKR